MIVLLLADVHLESFLLCAWHRTTTRASSPPLVERVLRQHWRRSRCRLERLSRQFYVPGFSTSIAPYSVGNECLENTFLCTDVQELVYAAYIFGEGVSFNCEGHQALTTLRGNQANDYT